MPSGRSAVILSMAAVMLFAKCENIAAVTHGDGKANGRLAIHPKHRLRRIGEPAANAGDIAQAQARGRRRRS